MNTPAKLTVLIPCKNEAQRIAACIDSVRQIADEILVADSGSTDDTIAIVGRIGGCRLIEREFVSYADFKNWAMSRASHPWVLVLDADERLTPLLADEIRQAIQSETIDGYWIRARYFFLGHEIRHGGWQTQKNLRLFRRDQCRYGMSRVHEFIEVNPKKTAVLKHRMIHYSIESYQDYFAKYVNYTRLGALDMWDDGKRANWCTLFARPFLRFFWLYFVRRGFLDGSAGLQICMLQAFFVSFVKQARLWEMSHAVPVGQGRENGNSRESKAA